eukprot:2645407-Pyramimonas_sp.AAC.1
MWRARLAPPRPTPATNAAGSPAPRPGTQESAAIGSQDGHIPLPLAQLVLRTGMFPYHSHA